MFMVCHVMSLYEYNCQFLNGYHSSFYKQVLECWYELKGKSSCKTVHDIRSQYIWLNIHILVDGKPLFMKRMYNHSILRINDILDDNGYFLKYKDLCEKCSCNLDFKRC